MLLTELSSNISSPEEMFQASLRRVCILIEELRLYLTKWCHQNLTKSQDMLQTMSNYMVSQHHNFKLQMQPQAVSGSDLSLYKVTSHNIFVPSYLAPDLDPFQGITRVFS